MKNISQEVAIEAGTVGNVHQCVDLMGGFKFLEPSPFSCQRQDISSWKFDLFMVLDPEVAS